MLAGVGLQEDMHIEASFGEFDRKDAFTSRKPFVRDGLASFLLHDGEEGPPPGVLLPKNRHRQLVYPRSELPDIIVYVCQGTTKLAFKRFRAKDLMSQDEDTDRDRKARESFLYDPQWHEMLPIDPSIKKLLIDDHNNPFQLLLTGMRRRFPT